LTKQQLQNYGWLQRNIQKLDEKILELRSAAEKITTTISNEPKGKSNEHDKMAGIVAKLADVEEILKIQLHESYVTLGNIEEAIGNLPELEKYLIRARYIDCREWEEICLDMNYSLAGIHKCHTKALKMLGVKNSQ